MLRISDLHEHQFLWPCFLLPCLVQVTQVTQVTQVVQVTLLCGGPCSWSGTRSQLAALLSQLIQEGRAHEDNGIFKYQRSPSPAADRHTSMLGQQPTQHAPSTAAQGSTFDQHSTVQATPESTQSQAQTPLPALEAVDQHPAPAAEPAAVASTKQAGSAEGGSSRDSSPSGSPSGSPSRSERMSLVAKRTHALRRLRKEFESGKLGPEEFEEKAAAIEAQVCGRSRSSCLLQQRMHGMRHAALHAVVASQLHAARAGKQMYRFLVV